MNLGDIALNQMAALGVKGITGLGCCKRTFLTWVVLLLSICRSGHSALVDLGDVNCKFELYKSRCRISDTCKFRCQYSCVNATGTLWGTGTYTYDSPLCRAAVHDVRISTWDPSARTAYLKRIGDTMRYLGSVRQGIQTEDYGKLGHPERGAFVFVSPRITEEILDVTSLHRDFLYSPSSEGTVQECHLGSSAGKRNVHFVRHSTSLQIQYPISSPEMTDTNVSRWAKISWQKSAGLDFLTGGFWCKVDNSVYSNVMSISMREDADLYPSFPTVTASIQDSMRLSVYRRQALDYVKIDSWYKEGNKLPGPVSFRNFYNVTIGDGGLYSVSATVKRRSSEPSKQALIRFIVRACPAGKTGPTCDENCLPCQNGGVCHDVMNVCICPPGFNGTLCENGCGPDYYGRNCTLKCSDTNYDRSESCRGILFCLPDPYGCSCATGFKGVSCNELCSPGEFGAGCKGRRECYCKGGKPCSAYTGTCPEGCEDGWYGLPYCNISYPYLYDKPPQISNVTSSSVVVTFNEWSPDKDRGSGTPIAYLVEFREPVEDNWTVNQKIDAKGEGTYEALVMNLKPDTRYFIRVVVVDISGEVQRAMTKASFAIARIPCGTPLAAPEFVHINVSVPGVVEVTWEKPPISTWQCRSVSVIVMFNNTRRSLNTTVSSIQQSFSFQTAPYELWSIALRLVTENNLIGPLSEMRTIRTAEDAPSEVRNVVVNITEPGVIGVSWMKPEKENGIIRKYKVRYRQSSWSYTCSSSTVKDKEWKSITRKNLEAFISDVQPSAIYEIQVAAITVKEGPLSSSVYIETMEGVPSGPPENLHVERMSKREVTIAWNLPSCEHMGGKITTFLIKWEGIDKWDKEMRNDTADNSHYQISSLVPFTKYRIWVAAGTAVGYSSSFGKLNVKTASESPPTPEDLLIYRKTTDLLSISWQPPFPPHGELERYIINFRDLKSLDEATRITVLPEEATCHDDIRSERNCYTIDSLKSRHKYGISIIAYNKGIDRPSEPTEEIIGETKESVPDPPSSVSVMEITNSTLQVVWKQPYIINGNLTEYRINITAIDSFNPSAIGYSALAVVRVIEQEMFTFSNLYPATTYNISVEAATSEGYGEPAMTVATTKHNSPVIEKDIEIVSIGETTVDVLLPKVTFDEGPVDAYYVVVEENYRGNKLRFENLPLYDYNTSKSAGLDFYMTAKFAPEEFLSRVLNFTIGDGEYYGSFYNAPLIYGKRYNFGMAVLSNWTGEVKFGYRVLSETIFPKPPYDGSSGTASIVGAVLGVFTVLLFTIIAVVVIFLYRRPATLIKVQNSFKIMDANHKEIVPYLAPIGESNFVIENDTEMEDMKSHKIPLSSLEDYVMSVIDMGGLKHEFLGINKGQLSSWEYAKRPENKAKNRFGNLLPYDHSRVILDRVGDDPFSDYINANFVDGYEKPARYIATQGPKPLTVNDFWRMIWQVESCKIVMVTNLIENGKTICEKYWPDTVETYGDITITLVKTDIFADFVIRTFEIEKSQECRKVKQFHFMSWPDHGTPMYSVSVVQFLKRVRSFEPNNPAPVVVHCSAGIGRTGTIILLDSMLDMARKEQYVDILGHLCKIRQQRINLVQVLEQYIFVHQSLLDALCYEGMSILCSEFFMQYNRLKQVDPNTGCTYIEQQLERVNRLTLPLKNQYCHGALAIENKHKNRRADILPPDRSRPYLKEANENKSNYINAVYVNGYKRKDAFICTQLPFPHTVSDFWQMIYETNSKTIVLLNDLDAEDQTCPQYWPGDSPILYGKLTVSCMSTEVLENIIIRTFCISESIYQNAVTNKVIKQFQLRGWKQSARTPRNAEVMIDLIDKVERWQKQILNPPVTVQCYDGNRACGLYCASVFVCDKIKTEQEVDVFLAVRSIRTNRPHFIEDKEQYHFLFNVAVAFLDSFETYSNFK